MSGIRDDVKNKTFKNMYLLYGEEAYLRNYYKKLLTEAIIDPSDNLNYSYFEGTATDALAVTDLVNTLPFMSEHRVILCENTGWLSKGAKDGSEAGDSDAVKALTDALSKIDESVIFIMSEVKVDKRAALYKLISSKGTTEEYAQKREDELIHWVMGSCRNYKKNIRPDAAAYLVSEAGTDMKLLNLEINKLVAWCLDRDEITSKDVDEVCTHQVTGKVFDMITAISEGRQKEALKLYYGLLTLRESGFLILSLLVRQYNNLLIINDGLRNGEGTSSIAGKAKLQEWLVKKLVPLARRLSKADITEALEACARADLDIKSGNLNETMSIELLIISLSNKIKVR